MATAPAIFPQSTNIRPMLQKVWIPVLMGLTVICFESTPYMGGNQTYHWLADVWPSPLGPTNTPFFSEFHHILRKLGHFTGYGTLGLLFQKAWHRSVRWYMSMMGSQLMLAASALAISCVFLVGSLDEYHQSFIPGRTSKCSDVLIDTSGALLFTLTFWVVREVRRRRAVSQRNALLGLSV